MGILVSVVDVILLVIILFHVPRAVWKGSGSTLLGAVLALAAVIFVVVSFSGAAGLIGGTSLLTNVVLLLLYLVMMGIVGATWLGTSSE